MGMLMRTALALAIVLIFAGTAHAQWTGGSINTASSIGQGGELNAHHAATPSGASHTNLDAGVNMNSKNPGEFVPSTFTSFKDVLAEAKLQAALRPLTVAEAARQEQERRSKAKDEKVIQLDEDAQGKLEIALPKQ
jgi:hypothetical protein